MSEEEVVVIRTGSANLASVFAGFRRIGARPRLCESAAEIETSRRLVLPGVGTLVAAMKTLEAEGFASPLRERIAAGRPTLAVCLGLQLLCEESEESPRQPGLGVVQERVTRFSGDVRIPQLGWNRISPEPECRYLDAGYVYFANSYRLERPPRGWRAAMADYGGPFVAAMERDAVLACQFHPELSGRFGLDLLERWVRGGESVKGEG